MSPLTRAGFFRELAHGDADGPTLAAAMSDPIPPHLRPVVAGYLDDGPVLVATTGTTDDVIDPARTAVADLSVHTDGLAVWPGDLGYYVRTYGAAIPSDLLERATAGAPPRLSDEQLEDLADQVLPPPPESA